MTWRYLAPSAVLLTSLSRVVGQRLLVPQTLRSCQTASVSWDWDGEPQDMSSAFVALKSWQSDGTTYTVNFTNIGPDGFDFQPIFHADTEVLVIQSGFNETIVEVEAGGDDCLSEVVSVVGANSSSATQSLAFDSNALFTYQCSPIGDFGWSGGVGPYQLTLVNDAPDTASVEVSLHLENITSTMINMMFPTPAGKYTLVLADGSGQSLAAGFEILQDQNLTGCLILPPSPSDSASSVMGSTTHSRGVVIGVSVAVGFLLALAILAVASRYLHRSLRKRRLSKLQERFDQRQFVKLEDVKTPLPDKVHPHA